MHFELTTLLTDVGNLKSLVYIIHNFSPETLDIEYGFKQSLGISSLRGIGFFNP